MKIVFCEGIIVKTKLMLHWYRKMLIIWCECFWLNGQVIWDEGSATFREIGENVQLGKDVKFLNTGKPI